MIKAVIFDLDGTLVQTESLKARAYAEAIRRLGNPDTTDEQVLELYKEQIGQTREVVSKFLMEKLGVEDQCRRPLEKSYGNEVGGRALAGANPYANRGLRGDDRRPPSATRPAMMPCGGAPSKRSHSWVPNSPGHFVTHQGSPQRAVRVEPGRPV